MSTCSSGIGPTGPSLSPGYNAVFLRSLASSGCRTLAFGLESLSASNQALVDKRQSEDLLRRVLEACAAAGVHPVINLMTCFPGEEPAEADALPGPVHDALVATGGQGFGQVEHNTFELERLAPLVHYPRLRVGASWPWASLMDWAWCG
jgi:hypothetical protein